MQNNFSIYYNNKSFRCYKFAVGNVSLMHSSISGSHWKSVQLNIEYSFESLYNCEGKCSK